MKSKSRTNNHNTIFFPIEKSGDNNLFSPMEKSGAIHQLTLCVDARGFEDSIELEPVFIGGKQGVGAKVKFVNRSDTRFNQVTVGDVLHSFNGQLLKTQSFVNIQSILQNCFVLDSDNSPSVVAFTFLRGSNSDSTTKQQQQPHRMFYNASPHPQDSSAGGDTSKRTLHPEQQRQHQQYEERVEIASEKSISSQHMKHFDSSFFETSQSFTEEQVLHSIFSPVTTATYGGGGSKSQTKNNSISSSVKSFSPILSPHINNNNNNNNNSTNDSYNTPPTPRSTSKNNQKVTSSIAATTVTKAPPGSNLRSLAPIPEYLLDTSHLTVSTSLLAEDDTHMSLCSSFDQQPESPPTLKMNKYSSNSHDSFLSPLEIITSTYTSDGKPLSFSYSDAAYLSPCSQITQTSPQASITLEMFNLLRLAKKRLSEIEKTTLERRNLELDDDRFRRLDDGNLALSSTRNSSRTYPHESTDNTFFTTDAYSMSTTSSVRKTGSNDFFPRNFDFDDNATSTKSNYLTPLNDPNFNSMYEDDSLPKTNGVMEERNYDDNVTTSAKSNYRTSFNETDFNFNATTSFEMYEDDSLSTTNGVQVAEEMKCIDLEGIVADNTELQAQYRKSTSSVDESSLALKSFSVDDLGSGSDKENFCTHRSSSSATLKDKCPHCSSFEIEMSRMEEDLATALAAHSALSSQLAQALDEKEELKNDLSAQIMKLKPKLRSAEAVLSSQKAAYCMKIASLERSKLNAEKDIMVLEEAFLESTSQSEAMKNQLLKSINGLKIQIATERESSRRELDLALQKQSKLQTQVEELTTKLALQERKEAEIRRSLENNFHKKLKAAEDRSRTIADTLVRNLEDTRKDLDALAMENRALKSAIELLEHERRDVMEFAEALTTTAALESERAEKFAKMHRDANSRALSAEKLTEAMALQLAQEENALFESRKSNKVLKDLSELSHREANTAQSIKGWQTELKEKWDGTKSHSSGMTSQKKSTVEANYQRQVKALKIQSDTALRIKDVHIDDLMKKIESLEDLPHNGLKLSSLKLSRRTVNNDHNANVIENMGLINFNQLNKENETSANRNGAPKSFKEDSLIRDKYVDVVLPPPTKEITLSSVSSSRAIALKGVGGRIGLSGLKTRLDKVRGNTKTVTFIAGL